MTPPLPLHEVVLIPGDGIGPEVTAAVRRIFAAAGAPVTWAWNRPGWRRSGPGALSPRRRSRPSAAIASP